MSTGLMVQILKIVTPPPFNVQVGANNPNITQMFQSAQKYDSFGSDLAFYSIRAETTLTTVDYGSPGLRITKSG